MIVALPRLQTTSRREVLSHHHTGSRLKGRQRPAVLPHAWAVLRFHAAERALSIRRPPSSLWAGVGVRVGSPSHALGAFRLALAERAPLIWGWLMSDRLQS
jgi:hypothetical protein